MSHVRFGLLMIGFLATFCLSNALGVIGCPTVIPDAFDAMIDVSDLPEVSNGKLRICMRDDPNDSQLPTYLQPSALLPYAMMNADAIRSYSTDVARSLASTLLGRNGMVLEADIFMFSDISAGEITPFIGCLQAVKDGLCDVGICNTFVTQERTIRYNVDWIENQNTQLEHVVVYPRDAACTTSSILDLCGRRVYTKSGTAQHDELVQLNAMGGACATQPIDIREDTYHFTYFAQECHHNTNTSDPCFLIGGAKKYWHDICNQPPSSEDEDYTNCDLTRFVGVMYGSAWAVRSTDEHLKDAISKGMQTLIHAKYMTNNYYDYAYLETKWQNIRNMPCLSPQQDSQNCATLTECTIPSGQTRCVRGCIRPNHCVLP